VQVQPQPQTTSRETRKPAQQQWQPRQNGKADQHSDKAPKANQPPAQQQQQPQQQKKQGQNCGQQAGACQ